MFYRATTSGEQAPVHVNLAMVTHIQRVGMESHLTLSNGKVLVVVDNADRMADFSRGEKNE